MTLRLGLCCVTTCLLGAQQYEWRTSTTFGLGDTSLAFDPTRSRTVMFRGSDTWEWDGAVWQRRHAGNPLNPRSGPGLAFDRGRGVTVLFAGLAFAAAGDTWEWDGSAWTLKWTTTRPPWRTLGAMVYDSARQRMLLYGGRNLSGLNDTWEYDGVDWTQLFPANSPTARQRHAMAYDEVRAVAMLFGGFDSLLAPIDETWEWDGVNWTQRSPATRPAARTFHAMAYDSVRSRTVMFGGYDAPTLFTDTWEWDGNDWTQLAIGQPRPPAAASQSMTFDELRGECVLLETNSGGAATWVFDGTGWSEAAPAENPHRRDNHALAYDAERGEILMFGGDHLASTLPAETWIHRTGSWQQWYPVTVPPARLDPALAFDPTTRGVLMFGGLVSVNDTWLWNGTNWQQQTPAVAPPPRVAAAMASDPVLNRVVMFGGKGSLSLLDDTWEWDGVNWLPRSPATKPPARQNHAMTFDPIRGVTMMFGGGNYLNGPVLGDHWEWNGIGWSQVTPAVMPPARGGHGLVFDFGSLTTVLIGGFHLPFLQFPTARNDVWEWDGNTWTQRTVSQSPALQRRYTRAAHDPSTRRTLIYGGDAGWNTWLMGQQSTAAITSYGVGCPGTFGVPALRARGRSFAGNTDFRVQASSLVAGNLTFLGLGLQPISVPQPGGCTALTDTITVAAAVADSRGSAVFPLPLPNEPVLQGLDLFLQTASVDTGGSLAGLGTLSHGLQITIDR